MKEKRSNQAQGKLNRKRGQIFESDVRADLESKGWTVCKWQNTIKDGKLIHAPHKFNPFTRSVIPGSGFPDFITFIKDNYGIWTIVGVEAKRAKYLDQKEKEMIKWYKEHETFNNILIAYKDKSGKLKYTGATYDEEVDTAQ